MTGLCQKEQVTGQSPGLGTGVMPLLTSKLPSRASAKVLEEKIGMVVSVLLTRVVQVHTRTLVTNLFALEPHTRVAVLDMAL